MPTKKEIEALKETVIEQLDKLNLIFISNDFKDEDFKVLSEIGILSLEIAQIFEDYDFSEISEKFRAIDKMTNAILFENLSYKLGMSYILNFQEFLNEALEFFWASGEIPNDLKESLNYLSNLILKPQTYNLETNTFLTEIETKTIEIKQTTITDKKQEKTEKKKYALELPSNINELDGTFEYLKEHYNDISIIVDDFYVELTELLQFSEEALLKLEENHNDKEVINSLFRYIHSIKGSSGFLNLIEVVTLTHFAESLLDRCRNNELNVNDSIVSVLLEVIDCVKKLFRNMLLRVQILKGEKITEQINKVYIKDYLEKINKILIGDEPSVKDEPVIKPKSSEQPSEKIDQPQQIQKKEEIQKEEKPKDEETQQPQNTASSSVLQSDTIRVAVEKIDKVYEMLGELIISISLLKQSKRLKDMQDRDIDEKINYLEMISDQLQLSILKMRMFPIKNVYDKLKRQVRDLIKKSGKKVEFTTIGAEIELDKIVIEEIYSPLMHTVRNSMDHGIEKTEERKAKGKNEVGIIEIKAENRGDNVVISIRDDGAGLNKKKILEKALKNKLISEKDELTDMQIYNLIFQPGFSTAEQVTEISGRGVGMDVVKKTVMSLGGRIEIETSEGLGTKFEIILPLSTSIIDGLIVKCGNSHLIFPIKKIKHTLICEINDIKNVAENKGKFIVFENKTVPLIDLSEFYKIPKESLENFTALILEYENQYYALIVDEILYKQKIVTKNLTDSISNICGVKAGTILGDGTIGLIIEPNEVIEEYLKVKE